MLASIFPAGYLCGSLPQNNANADRGDVGGELMQKAAGNRLGAPTVPASGCTGDYMGISLEPFKASFQA
jgi:hypothetical protein